jgi:hypothetical protein
MYPKVVTRANIAFAVSTVSQFMLKAGSLNWMAMKCIMRYLKSTLDFKLCLGGKDIIVVNILILFKSKAKVNENMITN